MSNSQRSNRRTGKRPKRTRNNPYGADQGRKPVGLKPALLGAPLEAPIPKPERTGAEARQKLKPRGVKTQRPVKPYRERRADAVEERRRRARALRRRGNLELAERLEGCRPGERCGSGACPTCVVRLQQQIALALRRNTQTREEGGQIVTVTLVAADAAIPPGTLEQRDHNNQTRVWKRRITSCNLEWAVGGVDFSCNESRDGEHEPYWCPHLFLLGLTNDIRELRRQLKRAWPAQPGFFRPVKVEPWDGRQNALLYCLKGDFTRRVSLRGLRFDPRRGKNVMCRKTSGQRLRADQKLELLQHLDAIDLAQRIFSLRAQVHREAKGVSIRKM